MKPSVNCSSSFTSSERSFGGVSALGPYFARAAATSSGPKPGLLASAEGSNFVPKRLLSSASDMRCSSAVYSRSCASVFLEGAAGAPLRDAPRAGPSAAGPAGLSRPAEPCGEFTATVSVSKETPPMWRRMSPGMGEAAIARSSLQRFCA
jgi:hypothetical protein